MYKLIILIISTFLLFSCGRNGSDSDAFGNFEATEITISSEASGKLIYFDIEEGSRNEENKVVGLVDTTTLYLRKEQFKARIEAVKSKLLNIPSQIDVLKVRKQNLLREIERFENMKKDNAATQKQLDDMEGELGVLEKELEALYVRLKTTNKGIGSEVRPLELQIDEINYQINKSLIRNPVNGTILVKYAEKDEIVTFGKPLYKIANLDYLFLRVYVSGTQLDDIILGQQVDVLIDQDEDTFHEYRGTITWISVKAEFTPKIVQTKEERVNLVYAVKVKVKNDGKIKIGMPGEITIGSSK